MQFWMITSGKIVLIASAKPVRLSMQAIRTSFMPRAIRSVRLHDFLYDHHPSPCNASRQAKLLCTLIPVGGFATP